MGYLNADIDPLKLKPTSQSGNNFKDYLERVHLDYRSSGFTENDFEKEFLIYDPTIWVFYFLISRELEKKRKAINLKILLIS
jgi:2-oxoglutarate dehydrogenase complex dehydrogenase (E1) component-like enzyme